MTTGGTTPDQADARLGKVRRRPHTAAPRFWLVYGACLALLAFRGRDRLSHPDLFAEGIRFVGEALNDGWAALLSPYDFYLHVAPKLVALLAIELAPVEQIPLFTNAVCFAVTAGAMASISRPCFRWLIPSDGARICLAVLLVLVPGLVEMLGNLPNLHWALLVLMATLLLKDPEHPYTAWELALALLAMLSSASAIVFLPVAFLRLAFSWQRRWLRAAVGAPDPYPRDAVFFSMLLLVTVYLFTGFAASDASVGIGRIDIVGAARGLDELLPNLGALFSTFYFLHPFMGTQNTTDFLQAAPLYPLIAVSAAVVLLLVARLLRGGERETWLIPAWLVSLLLAAVMLSIVRYWSFYGVFSFPYQNWWFRYNFFFASTGLIVWFMLLRVESLTKLRRWPNAVMWILAIAYAVQAPATTVDAPPPHNANAFAVNRYEETRYWARTADELERSMRTGCPATVELFAAPGGKWSVVYESDAAGGDCPEAGD